MRRKHDDNKYVFSQNKQKNNCDKFRHDGVVTVFKWIFNKIGV